MIRGKTTLTLVLGGAYAVLGGTLAVILDHSWIRQFAIVGPRAWHESFFLPIWVVTILSIAAALSDRLPKSAVYGLLVTGPPYCWLTFLLTAAYFRTADAQGSEYFQDLWPLVCLALSGVIIAPLVSAGVRIVKRRL